MVKTAQFFGWSKGQAFIVVGEFTACLGEINVGQQFAADSTTERPDQELGIRVNGVVELLKTGLIFRLEYGPQLPEREVPGFV